MAEHKWRNFQMKKTKLEGYVVIKMGEIYKKLCQQLKSLYIGQIVCKKNKILIKNKHCYDIKNVHAYNFMETTLNVPHV